MKRNDLKLLMDGIAKQTRLNFIKLGLGRIALERGAYVSALYPRLFNARSVWEVIDVFYDHTGMPLDEVAEIVLDLAKQFSLDPSTKLR